MRTSPVEGSRLRAVKTTLRIAALGLALGLASCIYSLNLLITPSPLFRGAGHEHFRVLQVDGGVWAFKGEQVDMTRGADGWYDTVRTVGTNTPSNDGVAVEPIGGGFFLAASPMQLTTGTQFNYALLYVQRDEEAVYQWDFSTFMGSMRDLSEHTDTQLGRLCLLEYTHDLTLAGQGSARVADRDVLLAIAHSCVRTIQTHRLVPSRKYVAVSARPRLTLRPSGS